MNGFLAVYRRELTGWLATPLAYVFVVIFLVLAGAFTFWLGGFYERGQADLAPFFDFHPWLYLFLVPAIAMRLWAEEHRSGSGELLLTLPVACSAAVAAKFCAAWTFIAAALALTFPVWATVAWLGEPDHGAILAGYLGSLLMAGAFLAIGSCLSATTGSQVIAFILTVVVCFLLLLAGFPLVLDAFRGWAPPGLVEAVASLGFLTHFRSLSRGVVDASSVAYFAATIAAWLYATTLVLARRQDFHRRLAAAAFPLLAVLFVALTVIAYHGLRGVQLDLTEQRLYTLAPGTERLVRGLAEPVDLYFFWSREAGLASPPLAVHASRVRELLEEVADRAAGRVRLHVLDPAPFTAAEDRAAELGLRAVPAGAGGESLYFGLAGTNSTGGRALIDFFAPQNEAFLEYDVARLINELAAPERPVVGVLSTLPLMPGFDLAEGGMRPGLFVGEQLAELHELREIPPAAHALPEGLDALVVVHPKGLAPALRYAIDQYVVAGGPLLLFVDPDSQLDPGAAQRAALYAGGDRASTLEPLLAAWGVGFDPAHAFGDLEHALLVGSPDGGEPVRHLGFAGFDRAAFDAGHVVTGGLDALNFATPGFLTPRRVEGVGFAPLVSSGPRSAPITVEKLAFATTPGALRQGFEPTGTRYVVAAQLRGRLPSAYPDGPPAGVVPVAPPRRAAEDGHVIVVADTDLLSDPLWVRMQTVLGQPYAEPWANNGDFVLNAVDHLTGGSALVGLRARAPFARPFERVEALRARADDRLRTQELELQRELRLTEQRLVELEAGRADGGPLVFTPEQQAEIRRFEAEKLRIRKALREVRRGLDEDIERLGTRLALLNVVAVPAVLSLIAVCYAWLRLRRRRAHAALAVTG